MELLRHALFGAPLLLLVIAAAVIVARSKIAEIGGLDEPYPSLPVDLAVVEDTSPTEPVD